MEKAPSASRTSVPPSEPRGSRASFSALDAQADRPARLQMIVALILGLVLVAIPLYLWRRPRAESIAVSSADAAPPPDPTSSPSDDKVVIGEAKVLSCHDPGPKKTTPDQCDRLPDIEKALAKAIEDSASCVPKDAGGGTIAYLADVSFKKKQVQITTPKDARSMKNAKVAGACGTTVKSKLGGVTLDGSQHGHQRYKVQIIATYPGAVKP
jgi:hypothetical protein